MTLQAARVQTNYSDVNSYNGAQSEISRTTRLTKSAKSRLDDCGASKTPQHSKRLVATSRRLFSCLFPAFTARSGMSATAGWVRIKPRERTNKADLLTFLAGVVEVFEHPATSVPVKSFSGGDPGSSARKHLMALKSPARDAARPNPEHPDPLGIHHQRMPATVGEAADYLAHLMGARDVERSARHPPYSIEQSRSNRDLAIIIDEMARARDLVCGKASTIDEAAAQCAVLMSMMQHADLLPWQRSTTMGYQARQMIRLLLSILDRLIAASDAPNIKLIRLVMDGFTRPDELLADLVARQAGAA